MAVTFAISPIRTGIFVLVHMYLVDRLVATFHITWSGRCLPVVVYSSSMVLWLLDQTDHLPEWSLTLYKVAVEKLLMALFKLFWQPGQRGLFESVMALLGKLEVGGRMPLGARLLTFSGGRIPGGSPSLNCNVSIAVEDVSFSFSFSFPSSLPRGEGSLLFREKRLDPCNLLALDLEGGASHVLGVLDPCEPPFEGGHFFTLGTEALLKVVDIGAEGLDVDFIFDGQQLPVCEDAVLRDSSEVNFFPFGLGGVLGRDLPAHRDTLLREVLMSMVSSSITSKKTRTPQISPLQVLRKALGLSSRWRSARYRSQSRTPPLEAPLMVVVVKWVT
jgi:hypothetical protein